MNKLKQCTPPGLRPKIEIYFSKVFKFIYIYIVMTCRACKTREITQNYNYFCKKCYFLYMKIFKIKCIDLREYYGLTLGIHIPYIESWKYADYRTYCLSYEPKLKPLNFTLETLLYIKFIGKCYNSWVFQKYPIILNNHI